jgi:hypothetical protein
MIKPSFLGVYLHDRGNLQRNPSPGQGRLLRQRRENGQGETERGAFAHFGRDAEAALKGPDTFLHAD